MLGLITGTLFHTLLTVLVLAVFAFVLMDGNPANGGMLARGMGVVVALFANLFGGLVFYLEGFHKNITNELRSLINEH